MAGLRHDGTLGDAGTRGGGGESGAQAVARKLPALEPNPTRPPFVTGGKQTAEPVHVVIDSTGLKVYGAGEWQREKHGERGRRT
jgi:hypothetical protein